MPGPLNPIQPANFILDAIRNGQGFNYTSGAQATAGAVNSLCLSVFNPNASKLIYIYSVIAYENVSGNFGLLNHITADPALGAAQVDNMLLGSPLASIASATFTNVGVAQSGTVLQRCNMNTNYSEVEFLNNGSLFILPQNHGLAFFINISAIGNWTVTFRGVEL